jgi:hypothetical protein
LVGYGGFYSEGPASHAMSLVIAVCSANSVGAETFTASKKTALQMHFVDEEFIL